MQGEEGMCRGRKQKEKELRKSKKKVRKDKGKRRAGRKNTGEEF